MVGPSVALAVMVGMMAAAHASIAAADGADAWPSFQGGPQHLASAPSGPQPALSVAWRWPAAGANGGTTGASPPVLADGLAIAVTADQVVALDASTGAVRWRLGRAPGYLDPPAVAPAADPVAAPGGILAFTQGRRGSGSQLIAIDLSTRSELWRFPADGPLKRPLRGAPVIADGTAFVGGDDGNVYAVDLATGTKRWSFPTGAIVQTSPAAADGMVFAVGEDARTTIATLFAIDASSGAKVWSYAPTNASLHVSSPTVADGRVFEAFGDGNIRAFDERTGSVLWSSAVRGLFSPSNALAYAGGTLFAMDATGALYGLDAASGLRQWDFQFAPSALRSAPLVAGATVYVGLDDGSVAAVEVSTGVRVWLRRLHGGPAGALAAAAGTLFVPYSGPTGGIVAFRHSDAPLVRVESSTVLHLGVALGGFAAAFVLVLAALLGLFGWLARRQLAAGDGESPDARAEA